MKQYGFYVDRAVQAVKPAVSCKDNKDLDVGSKPRRL